MVVVNSLIYDTFKGKGELSDTIEKPTI
jgi:hypothetical protein